MRRCLPSVKTIAHSQRLQKTNQCIAIGSGQGNERIACCGLRHIRVGTLQSISTESWLLNFKKYVMQLFSNCREACTVMHKDNRGRCSNPAANRITGYFFFFVPFLDRFGVGVDFTEDFLGRFEETPASSISITDAGNFFARAYSMMD